MRRLTKQIPFLILLSIVMISWSNTIDLDKDKKDIRYDFTTGILRYKGKPYEVQIKTNKFKKLSEAQHSDYKMGRDLSKYSQTARKLYSRGY
jgi:hypothetical protein